MKHPAALLLAVVLLAGGCGGDGEGIDLPDLECPGAVLISSPEDLSYALAGLEWQGRGAYSSGVLPVTPDLVIEGTLILDASSLPVSNDCLSRSDCSPAAGLLIGRAPSGAVGEGDANLVCGSGYARVVLTDTTVRLRPYLWDTHPCTFNYTPMVEVLPACGTKCDEGSRMCPLDGACYAQEAFCRACEGRSGAECACRGPDGPVGDGTSCSYWQSGDVQVLGTCRNGVCEAGADQ